MDFSQIKSLPYLSEATATERLKVEGYNELPSARRRNILAIIFAIVCEPMFLLLISGAILYLFLGSLHEALLLFAFVVFTIGITFYQENKTEHALDALRRLACPRALVIRDGVEKTIAGREVVRGDVLIIREGNSVPADAVLLLSSNLLVDESILTGESVPVRKLANEDVIHSISMSRAGGEDSTFIYSGTLVTQGYATALVQKIGAQTEIGKIGKSLQNLARGKTLLQKETAHLVKKIAIFGLLLCALIVIIFGYTRLNWLQGLLVGITMAMSILPEELPMVLVIFLAVGAWRISKHNVLTRDVPAVEMLGAATVLCVDKTGTLTLNQMRVREIYAENKSYDFNGELSEKPGLPEDFHRLVEYSILASQRDPFDPMEKAIQQIGDEYLANTEHLHKDWQLIQEYPLSKKLLAISHVWRSPDKQDYEIAAKGSPEAIADLCHFNAKQLSELIEQVTLMASKGLRVLGVAKARFNNHINLPKQQHDFQFEFIGLLGLADFPRPNVDKAIQQCYSAGINVIMITGDYPITAQNIAQQIGLKASARIITGPELDEFGDKQLQEYVKTTNIFARIMPEQKLRLVNALKANGEIVAMTGDGVNDAPALKTAHIGIAMGKRGTDVAREAASLVLLDDDFSSIVAAIKLGRRIFDNIKKAFTYTFAVHLPIIGLTFIPVLLKWPLIFFPVHIVFLELIIDPACSIVFEAEPEEQNIMQRPPRHVGESLFSKKLIWLGVLQGLGVISVSLAAFIVARYYLGDSDRAARTITFISVVLTNLGLILANRSWVNRSWLQTISMLSYGRNKALWRVIGAALVLLVAVLYVPFLRELFFFDSLRISDFMICLFVATLSMLWFKLLKLCFFQAGK